MKYKGCFVLGLILVTGRATAVVMPHPQETVKWCWAASGQMLMQNADFSGSYSQANQADHEFPLEKPCPFYQCTPEAVLQPVCTSRGAFPSFEFFGFDYECTVGEALDFVTLRDELKAGRPVAFSWKYDGGGGHMMVAVSVEVDGHINVFDPWPVCRGDWRSITYDEYVRGNGFTHWNDFFKVRKSMAPLQKKECHETNGEPTTNSNVLWTLAEGSKVSADRIARSFAKTVARQHAKLFMPEDAPEPLEAQASTGEAISQSFIGLDSLRSYSEDKGLSTLIVGTQRLLVPITVNSELEGDRTTFILVLEYVGGIWKEKSFGDKNYANDIFPLREALASSLNISRRSFFEVRIPSLNIYFLGYRKAGQLFLVPIYEIRLGDEQIKKGISKPAHEVLLKLRRLAIAHNGLPS